MGQSVLSDHLLHFLIENIDRKPRSLETMHSSHSMKLKKRVEKLIPDRVYKLLKPESKKKKIIDSNLMAFRACIIIEMQRLLEGDCDFLKIQSRMSQSV